MHDARRREADALRELAHLAPNHRKAERLTAIAEEAFDEQRVILERHQTAPKHALLQDTELAGKLRYHPGGYKLVIDTLRCALAVAEADLATVLASTMLRPREAKKALQNLLVAPGSVTFRPDSIRVCLRPAATTNERRAFAKLLQQVNAARLTLPGDPNHRPLHFSTPKS